MLQIPRTHAYHSQLQRLETHLEEIKHILSWQNQALALNHGII